jgi:hypothetical protein
MAPFNTKIVPLSKIQVSRSRLRKNSAAKRRATLAIRNNGQQRPLIIDPDGRLLADTASYLALKTLGYDNAKVLTLENPSPMRVRAVVRLLDRCKVIRDEAAAFNAALASLDTILETGTRELVLNLLPVVIADTGEKSTRLLPVLVSDKGRRKPFNI